jgi:hypothetical protein
LALLRIDRWVWGLGLTSICCGCSAANRLEQPVAFTARSWRLRIDVDSAPTRIAAKQTVVGTVDFTTQRHMVDLWPAINHRIPNSAYVARLEPRQYKIILGDSASFDEKIVMTGRAVTPDSIVGTWTETVVCCSAGGRFTLWR